MSITTSPNMLLPIPAVGSEPGPQYASDINGSLTIIDGHDHTTGYGAQIPTAGININADFSLNGFNLTTARTLRLQTQIATPSTPSDLGILYREGVDLFYIDGSGNIIQITEGGGIAGSPGSISNLTSPASASYVSLSSTFVWQSNTSTAANMDAGSLILRNIVANSNALTLSPPNAMGSNYSLVLPTLPVSQKIMTLDASGNMTAPYDVDNMTINISSNLLQVKDGGITSAKLAPLNQTITNSSGAFSTTSTSFTSVTNLVLTLTTIGRPVAVSLVSDGSGNEASIGVQNGTGAYQILRNGTQIAVYILTYGTPPTVISVPASTISTIDLSAPSGANVYTVEAKLENGVGTAFTSVRFAKLVAYEL